MSTRVTFTFWLTAGLMLPTAACGQTRPDAWAEVGRILRTENVSSTPYHRYNLPRADLTLRIGDIDASTFGLGAWVGFAGDAAAATMGGDLVVTSDELGPVLAELERQQIGVTAIHNHLAGATPQLLYIHIQGQGEAQDLAIRVDRAVALTGTPRPVPAPSSQPVQIDTALVYRVLGQSGSASGSVVQLGFQLVDGRVTVDGVAVDPNLGHRTPITIQMVDQDRAVASGDFAVRATSAMGVVSSLAAAGITATAMHSHLVGEEPQVRYIHFWADGPLTEVLEGLRSAIAAAN